MDYLPYHSHIKDLEHFHQCKLRLCLGIFWQDHKPDIDVLACTNSTSIQSKVIKAHLCQTGNLVHMPDHRLPKPLFYSELANDKHTQAASKSATKTTSSTLKRCNIDHQMWEETATGCVLWCDTVRTGIANSKVDSSGIIQTALLCVMSVVKCTMLRSTDQSQKLPQTLNCLHAIIVIIIDDGQQQQ